MAAPIVSNPVPAEWQGQASQMSQFQNNLQDTLADTYYTTRTGATGNEPTPKPGAVRVEEAIIGRGPFEDVWCDGECWFQWLLNRSGAPLAQYALVSRPPLATGLAATGGTVYSLTDAGLAVDELTHTLITITADAGQQNAAPENESAYVVRNTATLLHFQPDMSTAIANTDQYSVYYPYNIEAAAAGDEASEVQGVVLSADGISDNYWGWVLFKGRVWVKTQAALVADRAIIAHTAQVAPSNTSVVNMWIGFSPVALSTAEARGMVELQCGPAVKNMCVSA